MEQGVGEHRTRWEQMLVPSVVAADLAISMHVTASVRSGDPSRRSTSQDQRDSHLRSADFFEGEQYPTITFRSTGVEHVEGEAYRVHGDLTLHGATRPVTLDVSYEGQITDPYGFRRAGFAAEVTLSRTDYGLTSNAVLEAGGVAIGDKIKVAIYLEAIRQGERRWF